MNAVAYILLMAAIALGSTGCGGDKSHPLTNYPVPPGPGDLEELVAEPYRWESARTNPPASTDMVLIYGGGHHRSPFSWTTEQLGDYVAYTDPDGDTHWLFDSFLWLEIMDPGINGGAGKKFANGYTYNNSPLESADKQDWAGLIDYYFREDTGLGALEKCVSQTAALLGEPPYKRQVVVSIPEPIVYHTTGQKSTVYWGEIDGKRLDFSDSNDRVKACKWFIDTVRKKFDEKKYAHIELAGFYWLAEKSTDTHLILNTIAKYLDDLKQGFNWIPYFNASGYDQWESYGFHYAYLQPNYFFSASVPQSRLDEACRNAIANGMHMEIEFDDNALNSRGMGYRLRDYMEAFRRHGIWAEKKLAYYQGSYSLRLLKTSQDPLDGQLYHDFCRFVITRPLRAD